MPKSEYRSASGSSAENLFIELFSDTFGAEKAGYLYSQYHFYDIYQNDRFADFFLENGGRKIAFEIDDEASHNKKIISDSKFYDDLQKQNSMIYLGWDVFRWAVREMQLQPDRVKDELRIFVGSSAAFREVEDYLPTQRGKTIDGSNLKLKEHQQQALDSLAQMRDNHETIALLYHATGTGKTVTAVSDMEYVSTKRTVIFCASVKHAEEIAGMIRECGVNAYAVSGSMKSSERREYLAKFQKGEIKALCACDLLNEGWDCPETEVLFMARPTMSKVLYTQQLGRGMRLAEGKECLLVFDFVDNASQYNMPFSMHRLFKLSEYKPGKLVLGTKQQRAADDELYAKGEKPDAIIDFPVSATDYEAVDVFNWQDEAAGMISQMEFIRRVDVASETVERYIREGEIIPDLIVPMSEYRTFKYFKEETLEKTAEKFGWKIISDENRKDLFMEMVRQMDMSYSYKPVLMKAILKNADEKGRIKLDDIVEFFKNYYENRRSAGLIVEKSNSIFAKGGYTDKEAQRNILSNPFKRFEDMQMLRHTKTLGIIEIEPTVWKALTADEKREIGEICDVKLEEYFNRINYKQ